MCPKIKFCRRKYKWNACFIRCNQNWDRAWLKLQSCVLWKYLNVCELSVCLKKSRLSSALFFAIVLRAIIVSLFLKKFFEWLDPRSSSLDGYEYRGSRRDSQLTSERYCTFHRLIARMVSYFFSQLSFLIQHFKWCVLPSFNGKSMCVVDEKQVIGAVELREGTTEKKEKSNPILILLNVDVNIQWEIFYM